MQVRIRCDWLVHDGRRLESGAMLRLPQPQALALIEAQLAEPAPEDETPAAPPAAEPRRRGRAAS
jgi:hypothetical protein